MESRESSTPAGTVLVAAMAVAVLAGAPLVYLIWDALNELLTGNVANIAVLPTLVAASVFALLLLGLGRSVMRVMGEEETSIEPRLAGARATPYEERGPADESPTQHDAPGVPDAGPPLPTSETP